jgi:hypothetical protein
MVSEENPIRLGTPEAAAGDEIHPAGMREPDDFGSRERVAQAGDGGKSVDDVAEGTEAHDEETRLRHAGPCGWRQEASAWNGL